MSDRIAAAPPPLVSFVIPVRDDAARLARCLEQITSSDYPAARREIVVIDNGSVDGSDAVARQLTAGVVSMPQGRVAELRNSGARLAYGEILAFVDADNEIASGWIHSAVEALSSPGVAAVGALYLAPEDGTWVQRTYGALRGRTRGRNDVEWLGSGNLAVWRSAFEAIGGFDTSLETCEDVDFCNRLRAAGFRIVSDARLRNIHHGDPKTLRELFKGELWRGRDNLRVSLRGPFSWRALPSMLFPVVSALMIPVAAFGMARWLAGRADGPLTLLFASLAMVTPAALRVARSVLNESATTLKEVGGALAVACVFDLARALALIVRMPHHRKRSGA